MHCPQCRFENPDDSRSCSNCGLILNLLCRQCGRANPPEAKTCRECGRDLSLAAGLGVEDLTLDEKLSRIHPFLPDGLAQRAVSQERKVEGELREVTILFCEVGGGVSATDDIQSEERAALVNQLTEILTQRILDYEGTVIEPERGTIVAMFGIPVALEDAPQRAIRGAITMHMEVAGFNETIRRAGIVEALSLQIGINTGPMVVGTVGTFPGGELTTHGETVTGASRMMRFAESGTTYVTKRTFQLTERLFRFEALGEKRVERSDESVEVYRVIAPSSLRTRFDVSAERGLTAFVGRKRELRLLLDGFDTAKSGRGQAFSIIARAGVGKSRLLYEFRKTVAKEDVTFLEGKCLSYGKSMAYHPITDLLKTTLDVPEEIHAPGVRDKVGMSLRALGVDEVSTLPYVLELLSVKNSGIDRVFMSPEVRKEKTINAIQRIVYKISEIRPLIVALEDLHWMDRSSEDLLKSLMNGIPEKRLLLVFTYRPDFSHGWHGKPFHQEVNLNRLSDIESPLMVSHVLGPGELDRELRHLIAERTDGVPFFIEEFIRSLKDLHIIEKTGNTYHLAKDIPKVSIPSTIQDMINARLDTIPARSKEVLQIGSVIEREFSHELIRSVSGLPEPELRSHLSILKDSDVLYERGAHPHAVYVFKHALTREVTYDSILAGRRRELHEQCADVMAQLYKHHIDEYSGILTEHYIEAQNYEKAAVFSQLAGKWAKKMGSPTDAIAFARKWVDALERLPRSESVQEELIDARIVLAVNMEQNNYLLEAKGAIDPILDAAVRSGDKKRLSHIYTITGSYYSVAEEDFVRGFRDLELALDLSHEVRDVLLMVQANLWMGFTLSLDCAFEKGMTCINHALHVCTAGNNVRGIAVMKSNLSFFVYYCQGKIDLAYQTSDEAVRMSDEAEDIFAKSSAYVCHGISLFGKGFLERAIRRLVRGAEICEKLNSFAWNALAHHFLGEIFYELGEYENSCYHFDEAIHLLDRNKVLPSWAIVHQAGVALAKAAKGDRDVDVDALRACVASNKLKWGEGWMRRYIAKMFLHLDNRLLSQAEDWINEAIEADERNGMMFHLGRDYALYSEVFNRKGYTAEAIENLNRALAIYRDCGADEWLRKGGDQVLVAL